MKNAFKLLIEKNLRKQQEEKIKFKKMEEQKQKNREETRKNMEIKEIEKS